MAQLDLARLGSAVYPSVDYTQKMDAPQEAPTLVDRVSDLEVQTRGQQTALRRVEDDSIPSIYERLRALEAQVFGK